MVTNTVFIVDDDPDDRLFFCAAMRSVAPEVQCVSCSSGPEVLLQLAAGREVLPRYIFLDMNMPRMNGRQCVKALRALPGLEEVTIIMYSTSRYGPEAEAALALGAAHYITKPVRFSELCRRLGYCMEGNWAAAERGE